MTQANFNAQPTWNVNRTSTVCAGCGKTMEAGEVCWAALCETMVVGGGGGQEGVEKAAEEQRRDATATATGMVRIDYCEACWDAGKRPGSEQEQANKEMFSHWKTLIPTPTEKKRLFVDDAVLVDVFSRLAEKNNPQDIRFRFVLALILMRKRVLRYEASRPWVSPEQNGEVGGVMGGAEEWDMILRGSEKENREPEAVKVINPNLTPEQIGEVSVQLSQILAEDV